MFWSFFLVHNFSFSKTMKMMANISFLCHLTICILALSKNSKLRLHVVHYDSLADFPSYSLLRISDVQNIIDSFLYIATRSICSTYWYFNVLYYYKHWLLTYCIAHLQIICKKNFQIIVKKFVIFLRYSIPLNVVK